MPLILRKCYRHGISTNNFKYGYAGDMVVCPDWKPTFKCGNGLHGLLESNGDWDLLTGSDWLVIEANKEDIVEIDNNKCKFKQGEIIYRGERPGLVKFAHKFKMRSSTAFNWCYYIDYIPKLVSFIIDSHNAYRWAINFGDKEEMIKLIDNAEDAFNWALNIGNREEMIKFIKHSYHAYRWACHIGNKEEMIKLIDNTKHAYLWARNIGDKEFMFEKFPDIVEIKSCHLF